MTIIADFEVKITMEKQIDCTNYVVYETNCIALKMIKEHVLLQERNIRKLNV